MLERQREAQRCSTALADQLLTIDLEQRPELDQLIDVDSGLGPYPKSSLNAADTQTTTRHPIGAGDSTVTCTPSGPGARDDGCLTPG